MQSVGATEASKKDSHRAQDDASCVAKAFRLSDTCHALMCALGSPFESLPCVQQTQVRQRPFRTAGLYAAAL
jgi:hypothetical protein